MRLKKVEKKVGARTHHCLTPLQMRKMPDSDPLCFTWPCCSSWSWRRMVRNLGRQTKRVGIINSPSRLTVSKALRFDQVYEICIRTNALFSVFLPYLPQQGAHVCSPSVGPESTLAFWRVYLWCRRDEIARQVASQASACDGEYGDASVVWTVWFSPSSFFLLSFKQRDNNCIPEVPR